MSFSIPQKTYLLWSLRLVAVVAFVYAIFVKVCPLPSEFILPTTIIFVIGSVLLFLYAFRYLRNFKIMLNGRVFIVNKGVFVKTIIIVPEMKYSFVKCFTTPVMSLLGLGIIVIKVAKGTVYIPEVNKTDAERISKMINGCENDI